MACRFEAKKINKGQYYCRLAIQNMLMNCSNISASMHCPTTLCSPLMESLLINFLRLATIPKTLKAQAWDPPLKYFAYYHETKESTEWVTFTSAIGTSFSSATTTNLFQDLLQQNNPHPLTRCPLLQRLCVLPRQLWLQWQQAGQRVHESRH